MRAYDRLSRFYEPEWSSFSERFAPMIDSLIARHVQECASVLDVACGMGTLALALARRGHTVHGVDRSEAMVRRARACAQGVESVSFSVGDMRTLSVEDVRARTEARARRVNDGGDQPAGHAHEPSGGPGFDAVTCTFDSVNYLTATDDVLAMMRAVGEALHDGGLFVFDSNTERMYRTHEDGIFEHEIDGEVFYQETFYDRSAGQSTTVFRFGDGAIEVHRQRPYGLDELRPLLEQRGFKVLEVYSGIAFEPYVDECDRVVVVASKFMQESAPTGRERGADGRGE